MEDASAGARVHERLQKRHQQRAEDAERRREARESRTVAEEKGECFSAAFQAERASIEQLLSGCSGPGGAEGLQEAASRTLLLQKFLNDSVAFLTSYDLRRAQAALRELQDALQSSREACLPKKKFGFKSRAKAAEKAPAAALDTPPAAAVALDTPPAAAADTPPAAAALDTPTSASLDTPPAAGALDTPPSASLDTPPAASSDTPPSGSRVGVALRPEACGFSNMVGASLTKAAGEIQKRDVLLSHLTDCRVRLLGAPSTLHLRHIRGCEVLCGPVSGSVFVDRCADSTLAFPCQQLRTHNTVDTRVYLHVTSRAIVEDCSGVAFAPFSWSYPTLEEDFAVSGLDRNTNNWDQVDDFNWLAAGTPSPNWTVIPESDRRTNWDP